MATGESHRIADQLRRVGTGGAWHGPSLSELTAGLSAEAAAAHPLPRLHSIWEIVAHLDAWHDVVRRRLGGEPYDPDSAGDWPAVSDASEPAWRELLRRERDGRAALSAAIVDAGDAALGRPVPGKDYTVYTMLHGAIQHDAYHIGQIALLRRARE